jgi:bifunctional non-homologous end joining protein LigD
MSLKEYKRKRDFHKTPEPTGGESNAPSCLRYVIQKHAAGRLHYDFRLEYDGTLKSWAVPKGPSLDPAVKSLAVQVEDHPIDYANFEGMIPKGEYGGGTVMVWDQGTWEPEVDAAKGLKEGKLKFRLHGEKLKGSWALVRMGGRAGDGGKNWLLIKHRDDESKSTAKFDILKRKPNSVLSDRDLDQIASDADAVWSSNGKAGRKSKKKAPAKKPVAKTSARKRNSKTVSKRRSRISEKEIAKVAGARRVALPKDFTPQLATLAGRVPEGDEWLHELKFDGYRILSFIEDRKKIRLVTRNGNDWTHCFGRIADALVEFKLKNAILDGEVVALDEQGVSNFQQLQNSIKSGDTASLAYYVFDVPYLNGYDLTEVPLIERKEVLARVLLAVDPDNDGLVRYSDHIQGQGENVLQHACRSAMEGIIAKRADSAYHQFRSPDWLKVKCLKQQEFVIGGYSKPEGARVGFGALLLGYYDHSELKYAGRVGTGFSTQSLKQIASELKKRRTDEPPYINPPTGGERRGVTWVKPELVGEVEFTEWTSDGRLRHPSFQGLREDKPAKEVIREMPKSPAKRQIESRQNGKPAAKSKKLHASSKHTADETTVAGVRLSHPDRVLYPDDGFTKQDLAEYYERVADWVLPYVVKRPLTLVRCPGGHTGECFFQKHITGNLPDTLHGVPIKEKGKKEEYISIDDVAGLIALVQMGTLELHPWPAREDNVERPDYLVFDLDPGDGTTWKDVIRGAVEMRDLLEGAGFTTFLRTSGGKGLHVVVPIDRRTTWDDFKRFAKAVADKMTREAPDRYIATMSKAKRHGKIFIDYLRNQPGATAIASYSTRRRQGAPVATPIAWDELSAKTRPDMFNIKNLPKRLEKLKKDPWADFFKVRQSITAKIQAAFE